MRPPRDPAAPGRRVQAPPGPRASTRRTWVGVALAGLLTGTAAACAPPHLSNGSVTACYRAIPAAVAAVHDPSARLVSVHRLPLDHAPPSPASSVPSGGDDATVCAVVLRGAFSPGQVTGAPAQQQGAYALVLISLSHLKLVSATVLDHVPRGLGRRLL